MKKFIYNNIIIFVIIALQYCVHSSSKPAPLAVKGVLDLRDYDFDRDGTVKLDGEWEFYWNEFIPINNSDTQLSGIAIAPIQNSKIKIHNLKYIPVPSQWQEHGYPSYGYASYRLVVLLPSEFKRNPDPGSNEIHSPGLGIAFTDAGMAYELYINGALHSQNGKVGKTKEEMEINNQYKSFPVQSIKMINGIPEIELIAHISDFHYWKAGLWSSEKLGRISEIERASKINLSVDLIVFGSLIIMAIYHFGLFLLRRKDKSPFYFGIFCILVALRIISINERLILHAFPKFPFAWVHKFEFITFYLGTPIFGLFLHSLLPNEFSKKVLFGILIICLPSSALIIFAEMQVYVRILIFIQLVVLLLAFYAIFVLAKAILNRKLGAKTLFFGMIFFDLAVVNDIFYSLLGIKTIHLGSYGFLIFVFSQSFVLSIRFSNAFTLSENLANDLKINNLELTALKDNLELKVKERTEELEKEKINAREASKEIEYLNDFTKLINSYTDLNIILQYISDYLNNVYEIDSLILFRVDKNNLFLYSDNYFTCNIEAKNQFMGMKIPLIKEAGILYRVYKKKVPFYADSKTLSRMQSWNYYIDKELVEKLALKSLIEIPIILHEKTIGILAATSYKKELNLTKKDIKSISRFADQVSSAIYNSQLINDTEKSKEEVEYLNEFTRIINSSSDIQTILNEVYSYIQNKMEFNIVWILLVDKEKNEIFSDKTMTFTKMGETIDLKFFQSFRMKIDKSLGTMYNTYNSKSPFFLPDFNKTVFGIKYHYINNYNNQEYVANKLDFKIIARGKLKSIFQIPLLVKNEVIGILNLSAHDTVVDVSEEDLQKLIRFGDQIAGVIYNAELFKEAEDAKKLAEEEKIKVKERTEELNRNLNLLKADLAIAQKIQASSLKSNFNASEELEIVEKYIAMSEVGGDYYSIQKMDESRVRIFLADATGHGVRAALIMMAIQGIYDRINNFNLSTNDILNIFNREFIQKYESLNYFLTCIIVDIDTANQKLIYSSAGNPSGIIKRKNRIDLMPKTGALIGLKNNAKFGTEELDFNKEDKLFLFTDGIYEEFNGEEEFGEHRVHSIISDFNFVKLSDSINKILEELEKFLGSAERQDDITILGIGYRQNSYKS